MASKLAKPIMVVSGLLTCTMAYAAIDPAGAMTSTFGANLDGPATEVVVRNWGALITLVGAMLIYGAFKPQVRGLVLTVALVSKLIFSGLVLSQADAFAGASAMIAVGVDLVFCVLFVLLLTRSSGSGSQGDPAEAKAKKPKREAPPFEEPV